MGPNHFVVTLCYVKYFLPIQISIILATSQHEHSIYLYPTQGLPEYAPSLLILMFPLIYMVHKLWYPSTKNKLFEDTSDSAMLSISIALSDISIVATTALVLTPMALQVGSQCNLSNIISYSDLVYSLQGHRSGAATNHSHVNTFSDRHKSYFAQDASIHDPIAAITIWLVSYLATVIKILLFDRKITRFVSCRCIRIAIALLCITFLCVGSFHYALAISIAFFAVPSSCIIIYVFDPTNVDAKNTKSNLPAKMCQRILAFFLFSIFSPLGIIYFLGLPYLIQTFQDWVQFGSIVAPVIQLTSIIVTSIILRVVVESHSDDHLPH